MSGMGTNDNLLQAQERVISQERLIDRAVERPVNATNERVVEKVSACDYDSWA